MTPSRLLIGIGVVIVAKAPSNNVVCPKNLLNSPYDGCLSLVGCVLA